LLSKVNSLFLSAILFIKTEILVGNIAKTIWYQMAITESIVLCFTLFLIYPTGESLCTKTIDFPADQFWDLMANFHKPKKLVATRDKFKTSYLCSKGTKQGRKCSCELHDCIQQRTCCIDIMWNSQFNKELTQYIETFIERLLRTSKQNLKLSCESILPNGTFQPGSCASVFEYFMVSSCPDRKSIPHDDHDALPVIDSEGLVYKSARIAGCNSVKEYRYAVIEAKIYGSTIQKLEDLKSIPRGDISLVDANKLFCSRKHWIDDGDKVDQMHRLCDVYTQLKPFKPNVPLRWSTIIKFSGQRTTIYTKRKRHFSRAYKHCPANQSYRVANFKCVNDVCAERYIRANGTCRLLNSTYIHYERRVSLLPWQRNTEKAEYFIILICTAFSIGGYAWTIVTFLYFKELQNLPRLTSICMTSALFGGDTIFYIAFLMGNLVNATFCKIHAIAFQWCSLNAMSWALLTAVELSIIFSQNIIIPSKINRKRFAVYFSVAALIPSMFVSVTRVLDQYKILEAAYGENDVCWIARFEARLYFYIIPIATGYLVTFVVLVSIVYSLSRKINSSRSMFKSSLTHGHNITKFIINLCLILGLSEIVGFVQIRRPRGQHSELELIVNASFSMLYALLRSSRGIFVAYVYIFNKNTARVLKVSVRKRFPRLFRCTVNREINMTPSLSRQTVYFSSTNM